MHTHSRGLRRRVAASVIAVLVAATSCTWERPAPTGAATGVGENSSFTPAGVEVIKENRRATIDLSTGTLTATDLGAADGQYLEIRDIDVRGEDPIHLTLIGSDGTLEADVEIIRILVHEDGDAPAIALFNSFDTPNDLAGELGRVGQLVGSDAQHLADKMDRLQRGEPSFSGWLNGGESLGFQVDLRPIWEEEGDIPLLEYSITSSGG